MRRPSRCYYCHRKVQWRNIMRHMRTAICLTIQYRRRERLIDRVLR